MYNLQSKKRNIVVAGLAGIWYLDMSLVSAKPTDTLGDIYTRELTVGSALAEMNTESGTAMYSEEPDFGAQGLKYGMKVEGESMVLDFEKDNQLNNLMRKKLLIFFKDNHQNWRFIVDARIIHQAQSGVLADGKPTYNITIAAGGQSSAYYYSGTVTINSNRTLTIS